MSVKYGHNVLKSVSNKNTDVIIASDTIVGKEGYLFKVSLTVSSYTVANYYSTED